MHVDRCPWELCIVDGMLLHEIIAPRTAYLDD